MPEMPLCVNCMHESVYIVDNIGTTPQTFCDEHLPKFYTKNRLPENVRLLEEEIFITEEPVVEEVVVEKPKSVKKKKSAAAPAEAVAEPAE